MNKYIDADKLIAEIERELSAHNKVDHLEAFEVGKAWNSGHRKALENIRSFITSLQQEQPDNWDDEYREDELLTRFAFYTYKDEDSVLYLSNVFVEETSRNKGFGTKILQAAEKVAETIGAIRIRLKVKQDSPANAWYRKRGYGYLTFEGEYDWLEKNLEYLKPKQEQQEVDLEKEAIKFVQSKEFIESKESPVLLTARHFYELGLNARKEE